MAEKEEPRSQHRAGERATGGDPDRTVCKETHWLEKQTGRTRQRRQVPGAAVMGKQSSFLGGPGRFPGDCWGTVLGLGQDLS
jgi:hypothetical protein